MPALEMNILRPLMSQPPSRGSARVAMAAASLPASVSVSPKAPSARPSASGRSQRSRCSSLPKARMGRLPMVQCACQAAAMDWSARPICSIAATNPTVLAPLPPHFSGTSKPSSPASPIRCKTSTGQRSAAQAAAAAGATSR